MAKRVAIVGTGQTFHKSHRPDVNGQELINEAVLRALKDADLKMKDIDAIVIGNMDHFEGINYVDCWSVDGSGGTMKPIIKLTTGGTTGCTVAIGGYHLVGSGMFDRVLIIGWEKNSESDTTGAITTAFDPVWDRLVFAGAISGLAAEAQAYMARYGASDRDGARVSVRDRKHAMNNPHAQLRKEVTLEEVLASPMLADPIHLLDVCPRTDGACAVIMASEDVAEKICPKPDWIWAHGGAAFIQLPGRCRLRPPHQHARGLAGALEEGGHQGAAQGARRHRALSALFLRRAHLDRGHGHRRAPARRPSTSGTAIPTWAASFPSIRRAAL